MIAVARDASFAREKKIAVGGAKAFTFSPARLTKYRELQSQRRLVCSKTHRLLLLDARNMNRRRSPIPAWVKRFELPKSVRSDNVEYVYLYTICLWLSSHFLCRA
jgi:hypothetical protein